jgi:hypothetical protein
MDCPWCGCGWLFTCITCRKAFTFAKGVVVPESWEETARRELRHRTEEPTHGDISDWVDAMKDLLAEIKVGNEYVYFDGSIIPTAATSLRFEGWHSRHDLPYLPHLAALKDQAVLASVLENREYWNRTAV